jgi:hypothetical protein
MRLPSRKTPRTVEAFPLIPLDDGMDVIDYGAIEVSLQENVAASVNHNADGIWLPDSCWTALADVS